MIKIDTLFIKIKGYVDRGGQRSSLAKRNIIGSFGLKFFDIVFEFALVPLSLSYLTQTSYGVWLTIYSLINWFNFFDLGMSHGYRNKMAIALGKGDVELAKSYTSTIYFTIGFISTLFLILGLFIVEIINWRNILNVSNVSEHVLKTIMDLMIIYLSVNLTFRVISSIFLAKQMPVMSGMINTATKLFIFIGLGLLLMFSEDSDLISYASLYLFTPIFVLTILSIYFYTHEYRELVPSWNNFDKNLIGDLLGLGGKFFVIQIGMTILFMSDNLIISKILGPAEVTPYQIANKYFGVALMIFTILMSPFWSAITDAYIKKDLRWIKNLIKKLNYGWMSVCIMVLIMFIFYNPVLKLWVGNKINIPVLLACQWAIFVILQTLNQIYTYFLNGTGKLALQMWSNLFTVILNIPLSIYFAKNLGLGSTGVILATNISILLYVILRKIQYHKIINGTAKGVWAS